MGLGPMVGKRTWVGLIGISVVDKHMGRALAGALQLLAVRSPGPPPLGDRPRLPLPDLDRP